MLSFSGSLKIFVLVESCDMRKGFNGLYGMVSANFGEVRKAERFLSLATGGTRGSRFYTGTAAAFGSAPKETLHTARNGFLRVLYPYHPLYEQILEVFGAAGGLRDLVYVRMPNNATRGVPAWMFDQAVCGSVRKAGFPIINCQALLSLGRLLDGQSEGRGIKRHGSSISRSKAISIASASPDDTGAGKGLSSKRTNARRRSKQMSDVMG